MTVYFPTFNVSNFELRGEKDRYLTQDQYGTTLDLEFRIPNQLDWLAQMLGWNGKNYWEGFSATIDQKRQLLGGSFGVFNGFIYPEIVEIRNWSDSVVIKNNSYIEKGQKFYLNEKEYILQDATPEGNNLVLDFGSLDDTFYTDISNNQQLKVISDKGIPAPFKRLDPGISADRSFLCEVKDGRIILYPDFDKEKTLPYALNTFFYGSRYYFDLPVVLIITDEYQLVPTYDFTTESWYIDTPCKFERINVSNVARLDYEGSFLIVGIKQWQDPSDWLNKDTIDNFKGAWGSKGGYFPFHFAFDSLSIHGFDERKSILLEKVEREVKFDDLLNFVYQQRVTVNETPPPIEKPYQVWWDSRNSKFLMYQNDPVNCGPWIETTYPQGLDQEIIPDLVFPDLSAFNSYSGELSEGVIVQIEDGSGLGPLDNILGLTQTLTSPVKAIIFKPKSGSGWVSWEFTFLDEPTFNSESVKLPAGVKVNILNSSGLSEFGINYNVKNLKITITNSYKTSLIKYESDGSWYLAPPSTLRYIGETRLYESSLNYNEPIEGEMTWDFSDPDPLTRTSSLYIYDSWVQNVITDEWELTGNWYNVNTGDFGKILSLSSPISGSGYSNGAYTNLPLLGGSGYGATATIVVSGGSVSTTVLIEGGLNYSPGDTLYVDNSIIGGGNGFMIDVGSVTVNPYPVPSNPPNSINYETILVYCGGNLMTNGVTYATDDYQFTYTIQPSSGTLLFNYDPYGYEGSVIFPRVTISDSLTSSYTYDISDLIFSGLKYYASPNVSDSETLLRIWKSSPLFCTDGTSEYVKLSYPNALVADLNEGPSDPNWERYFIRLPPSYQRNNLNWQRVNLICQDFGYWGSPILPENMSCPSDEEKPDIYEKIVIDRDGKKPSNYIYSEPYLYSDYIPEFGGGDDFDNSAIITTSSDSNSYYLEGELVEYDPLHERRVDVTSLMGKGYGDWEGSYFRVSDCSDLDGHLVNDILNESLEDIPQPVWDYSMYKIPPTCIIDSESGKVDANHFKVGYAFFIADLSAAEEAVFDFK